MDGLGFVVRGLGMDYEDKPVVRVWYTEREAREKFGKTTYIPWDRFIREAKPMDFRKNAFPALKTKAELDDDALKLASD